jgi:hypothetical protein
VIGKSVSGSDGGLAAPVKGAIDFDTSLVGNPLQVGMSCAHKMISFIKAGMIPATGSYF